MKVSLKAARVNSNLTQEQAGKALGVSKDTIKSIESGKREIRVTELDVLCDLYQCTRDDVFLPYNSTKSGETKRQERMRNQNENRNLE